jgi:hypothetical protein
VPEEDAAIPRYEVIAVRKITARKAYEVGDVVPGEPGTWRVVRVESARTDFLTGEPQPLHLRLICDLEPEEP